MRAFATAGQEGGGTGRGRQEAGGRRQEAGGRRQEAEAQGGRGGRSRRAEDRRTRRTPSEDTIARRLCAKLRWVVAGAKVNAVRVAPIALVRWHPG